MTAQESKIAEIIRAFDWEMRGVESRNIMHESWAGNAPSVEECYRRQNRQGKEYDEQRAALRRVLRRFMPNDTPPDTDKTAAQLQPAAEKALRERGPKDRKRV